LLNSLESRNARTEDRRLGCHVAPSSLCGRSGDGQEILCPVDGAVPGGGGRGVEEQVAEDSYTHGVAFQHPQVEAFGSAVDRRSASSVLPCRTRVQARYRTAMPLWISGRSDRRAARNARSAAIHARSS